MLSIAVEMSNELKFLLSRKTYPSFLNHFSTNSLAITLKVSSSQRKIFFLFMVCVQISPCGFVCEPEES